VNLGEPKEGALEKRVGAFWWRFMGLGNTWVESHLWATWVSLVKPKEKIL